MPDPIDDFEGNLCKFGKDIPEKTDTWVCGSMISPDWGSEVI